MSQLEVGTSNSYKLNIYPVNNEFIVSIDTSSNQNAQQKDVETVVILDRSSSMGLSIVKIIRKILPKFFEILKYDPEQVINLIAFESSTVVHKIKVKDFKDYKLFSGGGTSMAPAVTELRQLFEDYKGKIDSLRIMTVSDGEIFDQDETKVLGDELATFASDCNIIVNSQAVRFCTSRSQPDTTALCSLLQLNNIIKSQMIDVDAVHHHEKIASKMADLFVNDGFCNLMSLKCNNLIFFAYPWKTEEIDNFFILPNRQNVFWLKRIPNDTDLITIDNEQMQVIIKKDVNKDQVQKDDENVTKAVNHESNDYRAIEAKEDLVDVVGDCLNVDAEQQVDI